MLMAEKFNNFLNSLAGAVSSGLTGGVSSAIGSLVGGLGDLLGFGDDAEETNKKLMAQQYEYSKSLMSYQHELNSPGQYLRELRGAGLSTALMYSKGANQVATSLGSSPSSDLAGSVQSKAILSQLGMQAAQTQLLRSEAKKNEVEAKGQEIENKVRASQSKEEIANAEEYYKFMNEHFYDEEDLAKEKELQEKAMLADLYEENPDIDIQREDHEDGSHVYYVEDENGNKNYLVNAVNMFGYNRRYHTMKRDFSGAEINYVVSKINKDFLDMQRKIYDKYGDKVESAKLAQAMAYVRNAIQDANMKALDYKTFEKLGLGPNVIRTIITGAQAISGNLSSLMFGVEAFMK